MTERCRARKIPLGLFRAPAFDFGDIALSALSARTIASFARVMPVPVRLSPADVAAVAAYVHAAEARGLRVQKEPSTFP